MRISNNYIPISSQVKRRKPVNYKGIQIELTIEDNKASKQHINVKLWSEIYAEQDPSHRVQEILLSTVNTYMKTP